MYFTAYIWYPDINCISVLETYNPHQTETLSNHLTEQLVSGPVRDVSYFLTGGAERELKAVSAPDLAPLNTDGAAFPIFSTRIKKKNQIISLLIKLLHHTDNRTGGLSCIYLIPLVYRDG